MSYGARVIRTGVSSGSPGSSSCPPPPGPEPGLLDGGYARSCSAMLKVAQMISLLIGFICVKNSPWTSYSASIYFEVVTMCDLIMILVFYFVYLFRAYRMLTCISWPLAELLHYLIGTLLLLIASIVTASKSYNSAGLVAGATFGFLATFLCALSIWLSYKISCITQSTDAAV
ncbi:CKLF-like MARVEL transmembrane domain-containing protein 7 [Chelonoidis abingdonii]|uniref:CKLF like MARVEL transmembrane domain containing 7 n=1 Tax=Chelonoidis abingdonii TaxID=106734 RepID=A0A8C0IVD7_CHEAB|nr:CKLF-like MARVEL transmembrane domain-containing protein 7 [Chelonoidis abingdonii]